MLVVLTGRRLFDARSGALAGLAFVSLPGVALGSLLVSTDTPLLFCFALAMLAQLQPGRAAVGGMGAGAGAGGGRGAAGEIRDDLFPDLGGGGGAGLAGGADRLRDAALAAVVALVVVAPNLVWNASNDFATLQHTAENADSRGSGCTPAGWPSSWPGSSPWRGRCSSPPIWRGWRAAGRAWPIPR